MSQYYLMQDAKRCIACRACEVVCKINKGLPKGPKPCEVVVVGPKFISGLPRAFFKFMPCFHCEKPWCIAACPTGAMQKRDDGIVYVDEALCVGCKACMSACPWGVPQWNAEKRKVAKCDYCMDRLDKGLLPACVTICVTKCLYFGKSDEIPSVRRERAARATAYFE